MRHLIQCSGVLFAFHKSRSSVAFQGRRRQQCSWEKGLLPADS